MTRSKRLPHGRGFVKYLREARAHSLACRRAIDLVDRLDFAGAEGKIGNDALARLFEAIGNAVSEAAQAEAALKNAYRRVVTVGFRP